MMARRVIALVLLPALLLAGCWDRLEINDLGIVTLVGIDRAEAGVRLTVGVVAPTSTPGQQEKGGGGGKGGGAQSGRAIAYSAEGATVVDAMTRLQEKVSRRLFWAHARVLVFGEEYARQGLTPALDFWTRHREPRLLLQVVVTPGEAAEFVQLQPRLERLLSEAVRETINLRFQTRVLLRDLVEDLRDSPGHAIAPRAELVPGQPDGRDVSISGTAIFRKDRLAGWLDDRETRGLLWLRNEAQTGTMTVDLPNVGSVSLNVIRGRTVVKPVLAGGRLRMNVALTVDLDVVESAALLDWSKEETLRKVEGSAERSLRERITGTLQKLQDEYGVDAVNFSEAVRRSLPGLWETRWKNRWDQVFPTLPVDLQVTAQIRRTGEHSAPLGVPENQVQKNQQKLLKQKE
ncbi:MAG TPA: Ger(x)C family spore germination protein [Symbiobacteriaceae bacterium]|nr:Ger(x)C family spore germination protein [Symbiobacteriaceae bacterium]